MKSIYLILIFFLINLSTKAQQVIPIEEYNTYIENLSEEETIPDGTYKKDVNNLLNKYTGNWAASYKNKEYLFNIKKSTIEALGIKSDVLLIRYKIIDSSGNEIRNTFSLSDEDSGVIKGYGFQKEKENIYWLFYLGVNDNEVECGDSGKIYLNISNNQKKMSLHASLSYGMIMEEDCPNGIIDPPFPLPGDNKMILTKQNTIPPLKGATKE